MPLRLSVAALVFGAAFALRAALALWCWSVDAGLLGDEMLYHERSRALLRLASALVSGEALAQADLDAAYQRGVWPPLHSLVLALAAWLPIDGVLASRLVVGVVGAASSVLAYRVGRELAGERAGRLAGALHAAHPLCLYYGFTLWSETLYAAFGLALLELGLRWSRAGDPRGRLRFAVLCGAAVGAMGLTRAAALPFLVLVPPAMVLWRRDRESLVHAAVVAAAAMVVMAPWNAALSVREGGATFFSSATGTQAWAGNNPFEGRLLDSRATVASFREGADRALHVAEQEARYRGEDPEATARSMALDYIRSRPLRFLGRSLERGLVLLSHDSFLLRFVATATAPPGSFGAWAALWVVSAAAFAALLACAFRALIAERFDLGERLFGLLLLGCVLGAPVLTVSHTRLAYPAFALAIPWAGAGWVAWRSRSDRVRDLGAAAFGVALFALALVALPVHLRVSAQTSSVFAESVEGWLGSFEPPTVYVDFIEVRGRDGRSVELRAGNDGLVFPLPDGEMSERRVLAGPRPRDRVRVHSSARGIPGAPVAIDVRIGAGARTIRIEPVDRTRWNRWIDVGDGLAVRWRGGALPER